MPRGIKEPHRYPPLYEELLRTTIKLGRVAGTMETKYGLNREKSRISSYIRALLHFTPDTEMGKIAARCEVRSNAKTLVLEVVDIFSPESMRGSSKCIKSIIDKCNDPTYYAKAPVADAGAANVQAFEEAAAKDEEWQAMRKQILEQERLEDEKRAQESQQESSSIYRKYKE